MPAARTVHYWFFQAVLPKPEDAEHERDCRNQGTHLSASSCAHPAGIEAMSTPLTSQPWGAGSGLSHSSEPEVHGYHPDSFPSTGDTKDGDIHQSCVLWQRLSCAWQWLSAGICHHLGVCWAFVSCLQPWWMETSFWFIHVNIKTIKTFFPKELINESTSYTASFSAKPDSFGTTTAAKTPFGHWKQHQELQENTEMRAAYGLAACSSPPEALTTHQQKLFCWEREHQRPILKQFQNSYQAIS